jgi:L,D-peptidoglycan transpeptidase YkuD (ErfK/YbiS/YcfS/YnhG family)
MKTLKVTAKADGPGAVCEFEGRRFDCLIGRTGVIAAADKREGDGKTPVGKWRLLFGFYRSDRLSEPRGSVVEWLPLEPGMGWCDASGDEQYNLPVPIGYSASHEQLWRKDAAYDLIGVLDHNMPGKMAVDGKGLGSAIFLHVWREDAVQTDGCVALKKADLIAVIEGGVGVVEVVLE